MNNRCRNCGFLNFTSAAACKRCKEPFEVAPSTENWQGQGQEVGYEMTAQWPQVTYQPAYQPAFFHTPVAALPARSENSGANTFLWMLLVGAVAIAAGIGFLWKFNKPSAVNSVANGWQEYQAPDNTFAISMPTKPVESVQSLPNNTQMHVLTGNMNQDGFYGLAYADYTMDTSKVPVSVLLDSAAQGAASNSGARISSKKSITLNGYPGLELDMEVPPDKVPGGGRVACRIIWVAPRIYIVAVGGPESADVYGSRVKFLDSFKLTKKIL